MGAQRAPSSLSRASRCSTDEGGGYVRLVGLALLVLLLAAVESAPQGPVGVVADASLREFLSRFEQGTNRFINGDAALWKQNASQRDDVTIMGAWGAYEKGWK